MKKSIHLMLCLITFILGVSIPFSTYAFDYVMGTGTYSEPTTAKPAKGATVTETNFNTTIRRITDAPTEANNMGVEYAKDSPENANGTRYILTPNESTWFLYNAQSPYEKIKQLDSYILGWSAHYNVGAIEPRWDPTNPNIFYFVLPGMSGDVGECPPANRATFRKYDISTDTVTTLFDAKTIYPTAMRLGSATEGRPSKDDRYWSWAVFDTNSQLAGLIIYDKDYYGPDNGKVIGRRDTSVYGTIGFDHICMSPLGNYVEVYEGDNNECQNWICVYTVANFPNTRVGLSGAVGHADWGLTADNKEVYFGQRSSGTDKIAMWDPATGAYTDLVTLDTSPGVHASGCNYDKPGWGLVSSYSKNGSWFGNNYFLIELKASPKIWRLANSRSSDTSYYDQFGTINQAGTKIFINSDWESGAINMYQVELPSTWYKDLAGNTPPTVSASADPTSGQTPLTVKFTGSANDPDGTIVSYRWYFGDGGTSTEQNPTYVYNKGGNYTATLEVTDNGGTTSRAFVSISVGDSVPPASPLGVTVN